MLVLMSGVWVRGWRGGRTLGLVVKTVLALPVGVEVFSFAEIGAFQVEAPAAARARYGWIRSWWEASSGDGLAAVVALNAWGCAL